MISRETGRVNDNECSSNPTLRILHISDIHAASAVQPDITLGDKTNKNKDSYKRLYLKLKSTLEKLDKNSIQIDCLVITGDQIDRGNDDTSNNYYTEFLDPLTKYLELAMEAIFIVPGNHDVDRTKIYTNEGLDSFYALLAHRARIPQRTSDAPNIYTINDSDTTAFWLVNSAAISGIDAQDIIDANIRNTIESERKKNDDERYGLEAVDPGYVLPTAMEAYNNSKKNSNITFPIAVLHHNPFSYPTELQRKYRFIDDGVFTKFLIDNKFKLVLHGHQHSALLTSFGRLDPREINVDHTDELPDIFTPSFLCLGAPSLGHYGNDHGFNLIQLTQIQAAVELEVMTVTTEWQQNNDPIVKRYSHIIPTLSEDNEQYSALKETHQNYFKNPGFPEKLKTFLARNRPRDEKAASDPFGKLRNIRNRFKEINAMYSLTVFPPDMWGAEALSEFFQQEGKKNILSAAARAKKTEYLLSTNQDNSIQEDNSIQDISKKRLSQGKESLEFLFSTPVYSAINKALENAAIKKIRTEITQYLSHTHIDSLQSAVESTRENSHESISIWGGSVDIEELTCKTDLLNDIRNKDGINITIKCNEGTPTDQYKELTSHLYVKQKLYEFPRIVLWDEEQLLTDEALNCIRFHEEFGFPLFWIPEESRKTREKIGHFTALPTLDKDNKTLCKAESDWNTPEGNNPQDEYKKNGVSGSGANNFNPDHFGTYDMDFLYPHGLPEQLAPAASYLDEFVFLLSNPNILLAADAYVLALIKKNNIP